MRIFVASWFFPPCTSSEGLVTFKLLKYSKYEYDVCSSSSKNWSYDMDSALTSDHIQTYPVETDSMEQWVEACIKIFKKLDKKNHYSYMMTRSMPPESILVGLAIKKLKPSIRWIASFADPIYRNPYEMDVYVYQDAILKKIKLNHFFVQHPKWIPYSLGHLPVEKYRLLKRLYRMEHLAMKNADCIIVPSEKQLEYLLALKSNWKYKKKCTVIPHSYDPQMYREQRKEFSEKKILTYVGYLDEKRMPYDLLSALYHLKKIHAECLKGFLIRFVGNIDSRLQDAVQAFFLTDMIEIQGSVTYEESLGIMKDSDYLLHIDADFDFLKGGSIFCASKIMDYIGSGNTVVALTNADSEAARIVKENHGVVLERNHIAQIAEGIVELLRTDGIQAPHKETYAAANVALHFDHLIREGGKHK